MMNDKSGVMSPSPEIVYEWEQEPDQEAFKRIMVESFYHCYQGIPKDVLKINSEIREWLSSYFSDAFFDQIKKQGSTFRLVAAKTDGIPAGYALFDLCRERFKNQEMARRRPDFESGTAVVEAAKLKKFSDADGSQNLWLSDDARTDFRITSGITQFPKQVYLCEMAVDPAFQRKGIGKGLVFSVLKQFPETEKIVLITRKANRQSRAFYLSIGFQSSDYMEEGYDTELYMGFEINLKLIP